MNSLLVRLFSDKPEVICLHPVKLFKVLILIVLSALIQMVPRLPVIQIIQFNIRNLFAHG